jgi:hypothetical protein
MADMMPLRHTILLPRVVHFDWFSILIGFRLIRKILIGFRLIPVRARHTRQYPGVCVADPILPPDPVQAGQRVGERLRKAEGLVRL